ncbi:EF-hand domain-containing protein [Calycomorphotria hydatis]|uniref:EF hand n=1 Tax=Calycomorphotria hydatis TaxID=2528027 RepID=A0A517TD66_9PLAN|nr:EF-hand domain-containing protein [Calycomorphotria hydatis]QDT66320.1 EF hand [Calycomorphotria hydatis]
MHNKFILAIATTACLFGMTICSAQDGAAESVELSDSLKSEVEQVSTRVSENINSGLALLTDGNEPAKLIEVIKTVRPMGYGQPESGSSRGDGSRGRSGGGNRGGGGSRGLPSTEEELQVRFKSLDANGDGRWTGDEVNRFMSSQPANSDGVVTFDEYKAAWLAIRERMQGGGAGGGHNHGSGGHSHGGGGQNNGGERGARGGESGVGEGRGRSGAGGAQSRGGQGGRQRGGVSGGQGARGATVNDDATFLTSLDRDRDRLLTSSEVKEAVSENTAKNFSTFAAHDKDRDGKLSPAEYAQSLSLPEGSQLNENGLDRRSQMRFQRMDADQDGTLSIESELLGGMKNSLLARGMAIRCCFQANGIDADGDQKVSREELDASNLSDDMKKSLEARLETPQPLSSLYQRFLAVSLQSLTKPQAE